MVEGLTVGLREYIERAIEHERELREEALRSRDENLRLQAKEYERRLELLNEAHERAAADRNIFFTTKEHLMFVDSYMQFRESVQRELTTVRTWGAAALVALGVLEFVLRYLWTP